MTTAIVLSLIGFGFVIAEVFFPSLGLFGIAATVCTVFADIAAFGEGTGIGYAFVIAQVILIPLLIWGAFKALPHTGIGRRMVLSGPETDLVQAAPSFGHLVGHEGVTVTALRPAGTADLDGKRVSVVGLGGMIDAGARIVVVSVEGTEIRVRAV